MSLSWCYGWCWGHKEEPEFKHCSTKDSNQVLFISIDLSPHEVIPRPNCSAKMARGRAMFWIKKMPTPIKQGGDNHQHHPFVSTLSWWVSWDRLSSDVPSFTGITLNQGPKGKNGCILLSLSNLWFMQAAVPVGFGKDDGNPFSKRVYQRLFLPNEGEITGSAVIPPAWVNAILEDQTYISISTEDNKDGELRAQLTQDSFQVCLQTGL